MRQIDFVVLFIVLIGVALFSMQNAQPATIYFFPGFSVEIPLAIELLVAAGIGAVFAWMYAVWRKLEFKVETLTDNDLRKKDQERETYINELQEMLQELETAAKQLPPAKRAEVKDEEVAVQAASD